MKVALLVPDLTQTLLDWGWYVTSDTEEPGLDAILTGESVPDHSTAPVILVTEIPTGDCPAYADFLVLPLRKEEASARIRAAQARRGRNAKTLHDLRSPLNAIQGYAELISEMGHEDTQRFANQIVAAARQLNERLERLRTDGV